MPLKDFPKIATFLPGRTVQEVVRLYYAIQVGQLLWFVIALQFHGWQVEFCLYHAIQVRQPVHPLCLVANSHK